MEWVSSSPTPLRVDSDDPDDRRIRQVVDAYLRLHPPIPGYDADDLYQEGRIAWLGAKHTFRVDGGASLPTYIGRVVENRLGDLWRATHASRRSSPRGTLSLNAPIGEDGDPLAELLKDSAPGPDVLAEDSELLALIARVRSRLTPRQREVLDGLSASHTVVAIAGELGVHRDTVYEDRRRIQDACRDAGLEDFLR